MSIVDTFPFPFHEADGGKLLLVMAGIYPTRNDAAAFAGAFGVNQLGIPPNLSPLDLWRHVLDELAKLGRVRAAVEATRDRFPNNPHVAFLGMLLESFPAQADAPEVPQSILPDFSMANGQQLRLLRLALVKTTKASGLDMVLSATRDSRLADLVPPSPFQEQVFELLDLARREGWLNELMRAALEEWPTAPELRKVVQTFSLTAATVAPAASAPPQRRGANKPDSHQLERIFGSKSGYVEPIAWVEALSSIRNRICRLEAGAGGFGTGCLIGPDLVLTCHHNVAHLSVPNDIAVRFDFALSGAEIQQGTVYAVAPDWNVISKPHDNDGLNFTLMRLARPAADELMPDGEPRGWIKVSALPVNSTVGEMVSVLHHPQAGPMKMSIGELVKFNDQRLYHNAQTEPGSSGAGCFNMALQIVGLHAGKVAGWVPNSGRPAENVATRIDTIVQCIQAERPGVLPAG